MSKRDKKIKDLMFERDRIGCPLTKLTKSGTLMQSQKLKKLTPLMERFASEFDGRVLYDITYGGDLSFTSMTGTELLSSAIFVQPCNYDARDRQIKDASLVHTDKDVISQILSLDSNMDKYQLVRQPFRQHTDAVVFLCGSNIFDDVVDISKVTEAVKNGAVVKPHPLTNHNIIDKQKRLWGEQNIINSKVSGWDVLNKTDTVFTLSNSEMSIYATMLGKEVLSCEREFHKKNLAYKPLFDLIMESDNPYQSLNNVFDNHQSGIFFVWDDQDKIAKYIEYSRNVIEGMRDG